MSKPPGITGRPRLAGHADVEMGRRLRLRRVETGLTQSELAVKLGVSFQQVQKYEKGTNRINASRLQTIATVLDVPAAFFFDEPGRTKKNGAQREVESLLFLDSTFSLRLLRAYSRVKNPKVQRQFVSMIEAIAGPA